MYISRVEIDLNNRKKTKDLTHIGAFHNWVERSFPDEVSDSARTRKLWRIDQIGDKQFLILISRTEPDLEQLEKYGVKGTAETKLYDQYLDSLKKGMRLRFRVTLNPVISISEGIGKRGRVMPHVTVQHQMKYLLDRAQKSGFILDEDEYAIVERGYAWLKKTGEKDLRLIKATYEGILTIQDKDRFLTTLIEGIGKKKAYGFGLMTVVPLSE